jgi:hypothetical protein
MVRPDASHKKSIELAHARSNARLERIPRLNPYSMAAAMIWG